MTEHQHQSRRASTHDDTVINAADDDDVVHDDDNDRSIRPLLRSRRNNNFMSDGWELLPEEMRYKILSYGTVRSLLQQKQVCRQWCHLATGIITAKKTATSQQLLQTNQQLRTAVQLYVKCCSFDNYTSSLNNNTETSTSTSTIDDDIEYITCTYGWPIGIWDVSFITDFYKTFQQATKFNDDISLWDVSNAITMNCMFYHATLFNGDISNWNVSNVISMDSMFDEAKTFNCNINNWNISNVTSMNEMFS